MELPWCGLLSFLCMAPGVFGPRVVGGSQWQAGFLGVKGVALPFVTVVYLTYTENIFNEGGILQLIRVHAYCTVTINYGKPSRCASLRLYP